MGWSEVQTVQHNLQWLRVLGYSRNTRKMSRDSLILRPRPAFRRLQYRKDFSFAQGRSGRVGVAKLANFLSHPGVLFKTLIPLVNNMRICAVALTTP